MQDLEAKLFTLERVSFCHCNTAILFFLYTLQFDTLCQMSDLSLVKKYLVISQVSQIRLKDTTFLCFTLSAKRYCCGMMSFLYVLGPFFGFYTLG